MTTISTEIQLGKRSRYEIDRDDADDRFEPIQKRKRLMFNSQGYFISYILSHASKSRLFVQIQKQILMMRLKKTLRKNHKSAEQE